MNRSLAILASAAESQQFWGYRSGTRLYDVKTLTFFCANPATSLYNEDECE